MLAWPVSQLRVASRGRVATWHMYWCEINKQVTNTTQSRQSAVENTSVRCQSSAIFLARLWCCMSVTKNHIRDKVDTSYIMMIKGLFATVFYLSPIFIQTYLHVIYWNIPLALFHYSNSNWFCCFRWHLILVTYKNKQTQSTTRQFDYYLQTLRFRCSIFTIKYVHIGSYV